MNKNPCYNCDKQRTDACMRDACDDWDKFVEAVQIDYERSLIPDE
jgi:hypothetical protein